MQKSISDFSNKEEKKENNQSSKYKCFTCGKPIKFMKGERKKRFNLDGSVHECSQEDREAYRNTKDFNDRYNAYQKEKREKYLRWLKWWHGYGKKRYRYGWKEEYNRYNRKEYEDRWNQARQERERYQKQYYNPHIDISGALEILGINRAEFDKIPEKNQTERFNLIKIEYRKIALMYHPDRFNVKNPQATEAQKAEAVEKFRKATEAYEFLEQKIFN